MDIAGLIADLDQDLAEADAALAAQFPGDADGRQPVHTVYVPADQYTARTVHDYGRLAQTSVIGAASDFLEVIDGDEALLDRVLRKLEDEPVEDLRIDFEDGYGVRSDDEEDAAARSAAAALRESIDAGEASPFNGIRFKSMERETRARGIRTLATFLETLGQIPEGFVVTLPKVTSVAQVEAMVVVAERLEPAPDTLLFEIQVETPQAVLGPDGTSLVARMIHAAAGRCTGLHYGTYDYSASLGISAAYQSLEHPAADHAKEVMQAAAAGTGVRVSDGSTNQVPVGEPAEIREAWALHLRLVTRSLERGYYQGWDLHPAQLPTRYAANFVFYRRGLAAAGRRLRAYLAKQNGGVMDEPATARALAGFLLRGHECGELSIGDLRSASGLDLATIREHAGRRPAGQEAGE
jgi:citrate lyase beta subunit